MTVTVTVKFGQTFAGVLVRPSDATTAWQCFVW